ncbi:MAG: hypothetical protein KC766_15345, partial [Myxococcales bacterium]|nr:hypothetical protein [Myxococcales bacterium]
MGTRSAWVVVALGLVSWGCAASGDIEDDQNAGQGGTTGGGTGGQSGVGGSGGQAGAGQGGSAGAAGAGGGTGGTAGAAAAGGTSGSAAGGAGASGGAAGSGGASGSGGAAGGSGGSAAGGTSGTAGSGGTAPTEGLVVTGLTGSIAIRGVNLGAGWVTESLAQETESGCAVTAGRLGGLVVMRATGNKLRYMTVDTAGNWTSPADVGSGTTRATPAATTTANGTHRLVFHGDDFKYYSADYSGGAWAGSFTNVGSPQAYGPLPVSIAARDAAYAIAYKGDNTRLITQ